MLTKNNHFPYIEKNDFKIIVNHTPLVSVDLIVRYNHKILLGKRVNKPAKNYWFTLGGRVLKNESIVNAIKRIAQVEIGIELEEIPRFIGVFEHLYDDSIFNNISTHYLNLGYEVEVPLLTTFPIEQHDEYKWFEQEELMQDENVHPYVKDYFSKARGSVPQKICSDGKLG